MIRWLTNKLHRMGMNQAVNELERQIRILRGMNDMEIAHISVLAAEMKARELQSGTIGEVLFNGGDNEAQHLEAAKLLGKIKGCRDVGNQASLDYAAGAVIWLHTARANIHHELRCLGYDMWDELERGADYVDAAYQLRREYLMKHDPVGFLEMMGPLPEQPPPLPKKKKKPPQVIRYELRATDGSYQVYDLEDRLAVALHETYDDADKACRAMNSNT